MLPDVPVPPLPLEVVADKQPPAEARASRSAPDEPATHAAETASAMPVETTQDTEHSASVLRQEGAGLQLGAEAVEARETAGSGEPSAPAEANESHEARDARIAALAVAAPAAPFVQKPLREPPVSEEIRYNDDEDQPARRARWPWALAAGLAALALCGQAAYTFRSELAAHIPAVKPALTQACEALPPQVRCTVPPLQRPSALTIQASDMLILDKAKPHLVQLIVTLQNQSALDVGYPAIDLVLNDRFDHALARRVFLPAEYLRGEDTQKNVIAASVTATIRINLDVSELNAGGFGLLLIPAPQS